MSRRWRLRLAVPAVLLLVAIGFLVPSTPSDWSFGVGWGIAGVVGVILVSYLLLYVGESEDEERERERKARPRRKH